MSEERPYYKDQKMRPVLFYVVFGVKEEPLSVSRERHHVDMFPDGLTLTICKKPENGAYMAEMIGGTLGEVLAKNNPVLYRAIEQTDKWAIIRGTVEQDRDLSYMRNVIGFIQAFTEAGAVGVLDLQTVALFSAAQWRDRFFSRPFCPYDHVTIFTSDLKDGTGWLHTRGMRKFGRPDISIESVDAGCVKSAARIVNQMIYAGALGAFFSKPVRLHPQTGETCVIKPDFVDDDENPDFNNSYYRVLWPECTFAQTDNGDVHGNNG